MFLQINHDKEQLYPSANFNSWHLISFFLSWPALFLFCAVLDRLSLYGKLASDLLSSQSQLLTRILLAFFSDGQDYRGWLPDVKCVCEWMLYVSECPPWSRGHWSLGSKVKGGYEHPDMDAGKEMPFQRQKALFDHKSSLQPPLLWLFRNCSRVSSTNF